MVHSYLPAYSLAGLVQYKRGVGTNPACEQPYIAFDSDALKASRPQLYVMLYLNHRPTEGEIS
jgi:hypothetical protein